MALLADGGKDTTSRMSAFESVRVSDILWVSSLCEASSAKSLFLQSSGKWTTSSGIRQLKPEERVLECEVKLESPIRIAGIDVGNFRSAFIKISVSRELGSSHSFLPSKVLLSRSESVSGEGSRAESVHFFDSEDLDPSAKERLWDRLKISVSQPYNIKGERFGLSMFVIRGVRTRSVPAISPSKSSVQNLINKAQKHLNNVQRKKPFLHYRIRLSNFLKNSSPKNSHSELLQKFYDANPDFIPLKEEEKVLLEEIRSFISTPKRKREVDRISSQPKKKGKFDPSLLKTLTEEERKCNNVIVQVRVYKKDKKLPCLEPSSEVFVKKGVPVTFYKIGSRVYMEVSDIFYKPQVEEEHVLSIFKDYTPEQVFGTKVVESSKNQILHVCPICNEAEFPNTRALEAHCWTCNGKEEMEPQPGPSGLQKQSCPLCFKKFLLQELLDHAQICGI